MSLDYAESRCWSSSVRKTRGKRQSTQKTCVRIQKRRRECRQHALAQRTVLQNSVRCIRGDVIFCRAIIIATSSVPRSSARYLYITAAFCLRGHVVLSFLIIVARLQRSFHYTNTATNIISQIQNAQHRQRTSPPRESSRYFLLYNRDSTCLIFAPVLRHDTFLCITAAFCLCGHVAMPFLIIIARLQRSVHCTKRATCSINQTCNVQQSQQDRLPLESGQYCVGNASIDSVQTIKCIFGGGHPRGLSSTFGLLLGDIQPVAIMYIIQEYHEPYSSTSM